MGKRSPNREEILDAIRRTARELGRTPSRVEFIARSGIVEYHVLKYFSNWNSAVEAAGLPPNTSNVHIEDAVLLEDWANLARKLGHIPTRGQYIRDGHSSSSTLEKHFGSWSKMPDVFRQFAENRPEWSDVVALLPDIASAPKPGGPDSFAFELGGRSIDKLSKPRSNSRHSKLDDRPIYGNPIDFRGLRHEPVNENGVIFLFGIVARELGYSVEAVQQGFPDCEAKRLVAPGKWQRVRIEFEYESRSFRDHGHAADGCDVIVCWRDNWPDCPEHIEVIELSEVIKQLGKSED